MSEKVPDPAESAGLDQFKGSRRAGYGSERARLTRVIAWLRSEPERTLASGEGRLLLEHIDRLEAELREHGLTDTIIGG